MGPLITVITGPPCAGKTTHAHQHAGPDAVIVDLDALAHALGHPDTRPVYNSDHPARRAAFDARATILRHLSRYGPDVWVIAATLDPLARSTYEARGATIVDLDPGLHVCLDRATRRPPETRDAIQRWYAARDAGEF